MKFSLILLLTSVISFNLTAQISSGGTVFTLQLNTITTAVPFLQIAPDARAAGMGDIGAATVPDAFSMHWNTSKLAFSEKRTEVGLSYSPWLKQLFDDIHFMQASGYSKLGNRHTLGASMTYFSLGNITFTDPQGNLIREFSPNEFEFSAGYAFRLSKRSALGVNLKYIHSNLTDGISAGTIATRPGQSMAGDISYYYFNEDIHFGKQSAEWSFGAVISNLGNKMAYTADSDRDFLPANLRIGAAYGVHLNEKNKITASLDFNKLLVPTMPVRDFSGAIISGMDNNVGTVPGIIQSFYDAPGNVNVSAGGVVVVQKHSRLKEELNEINIGGGLEYFYNDFLAIRGGYFYEHQLKGARQYATLGTGVYFGGFGLDFSYLLSLNSNNPLANTMRFALNFAI